MTKQMEIREPLQWTGERLVRGCPPSLTFEHLHRYAIACPLASGKRVLDIACGEGYGTALLAQSAASITGVDIDPSAIAHAKATYNRDNVEFILGTGEDIPCDDSTFDLVTSFDTIEHLTGQQRFIEQIKRVLTENGVVLISTPNKPEYARVSEIPNPFHQREVSHEEFRVLLRRHFKHTIFAKQRLVTGSWIAVDKPNAKIGTSTFSGSYDCVRMEEGLARGLYSWGFCSDSPLPKCDLGLFEAFDASTAIWRILDRCSSSVELGDSLRELEQDFERKAIELADAGREVLRLRSESLRSKEQIEISGAMLDEIKNRVRALESQRDQLRDMLQTVLQDLDVQHLGSCRPIIEGRDVAGTLDQCL
jgi:SAM-dependent methyltransferase